MTLTELRNSRELHESRRLRANRKYKAAKKGSRSAIYWLAVRGKEWAIVQRRQRQIKKLVAKQSSSSFGSSDWAGSRAVTNEIISIVNGRAPITSRKRNVTLGNPSSDHYVGNKTADAVDFGTANNHALKNEISRKLGGPSSLPDYGSFYITRNGHRYRVQGIAGTHGTGPHLHFGVRRA